MENLDPIEVTSSIIEALQSKYDLKYFQRDCPVVYTGQVPNVCICLVEGEVFVSSEERVEVFKPLQIFGAERIYEQIVSPVNLLIRARSKALILDRNDVIAEKLCFKRY